MSPCNTHGGVPGWPTFNEFVTGLNDLKFKQSLSRHHLYDIEQFYPRGRVSKTNNYFSHPPNIHVNVDYGNFRPHSKQAPREETKLAVSAPHPPHPWGCGEGEAC